MYLHVRVLPESKKELIKILSTDKWYICVKEPAEQNRANTRVLEIVAEKYGIAPAQVRMIHGHHQPTKLLEIQGLKE